MAKRWYQEYEGQKFRNGKDPYTGKELSGQEELADRRWSTQKTLNTLYNFFRDWIPYQEEEQSYLMKDQEDSGDPFRDKPVPPLPSEALLKNLIYRDMLNEKLLGLHRGREAKEETLRGERENWEGQRSPGKFLKEEAGMLWDALQRQYKEALYKKTIEKKKEEFDAMVEGTSGGRMIEVGKSQKDVDLEKVYKMFERYLEKRRKKDSGVSISAD